MLAFLVTNIAASSFAERCRVPVYVLFSILMSGKLIIHTKVKNHLLQYRICLSISFSLDVGY